MKSKIKLRVFLIIVLVLSILCLLTFIKGEKQNKAVNKNITRDVSIDKNDELLTYFKKTHNNKIIKASEYDINSDSKDDLVIIYKISNSKNGMVVVTSKDGELKESNEVLAPIDNQKIEFKNIDNKPPMEVIVSGSKNNKFGYAIFRLENNKLKDLFGEGMKDCC